MRSHNQEDKRDRRYGEDNSDRTHGEDKRDRILGKMRVRSHILKLQSLIGKYWNPNPKTLITVIAWNPITVAISA